MTTESLDNFVARLGYAFYPTEEKAREEYTNAVIDNLPQGQTHLFYVTLNVRVPPSTIDPILFSTREAYRRALIDEQKKFLAGELAAFRNFMEEMGVKYNPHMFRLLCLNLTAEQALGVMYHRQVKKVEAYHP